MWTRPLLPLVFASLTAPAMAQPPLSGRPQLFEINPAHSLVGLSVRFMGLSKVRGAFASFAGSILYFADQPERSSVSAIILTRSINNQRDRPRSPLTQPRLLRRREIPLHHVSQHGRPAYTLRIPGGR